MFTVSCIHQGQRSNAIGGAVRKAIARRNQATKHLSAVAKWRKCRNDRSRSFFALPRMSFNQLRELFVLDRVTLKAATERDTRKMPQAFGARKTKGSAFGAFIKAVTNAFSGLFQRKAFA